MCFSIGKWKITLAANKAVVSDGNARCSPTLVGLDNVAGSQFVSKSWPKCSLLEAASCRKYLRRNPVRVCPFLPLLGAPHFPVLARAFENFKYSLPPLSATGLPLTILLALKSLDEPLQFGCIAICLLNFLHPPTTLGDLANARIFGNLLNLQFLVPHSLTLPEYLAQFECKLDYYSLTFTMRSSSVASPLVS